MILVQQNGKIFGPYPAKEVDSMLLLGRVKSSDLFGWPGAELWLNFTEFKPFLQLLKNEDTIFYGDKDLLVTQDRLLTQTQMFLKEQIDGFEVVIPEAVKTPKGEWVRNMFWWFGVIFFWTLVVPLAVWFLNKKTPQEEGLGEVFGIRLIGKGVAGEMIKEGMGILATDDPRRPELAKIYQILKEWKAGNLPVPSGNQISESPAPMAVSS